MAVYYDKKKKTMFHKPQTTGEVKAIPMNLPMKIVSIAALVLLAGLIALSIYGYTQHNNGSFVLAEGWSMPSGVVFLFLPIVALIICLGFRLALRAIPLNMWRLPASIKNAAIKTEGKYLKFCTLLLEMETTIMFLFITYVLNLGAMPGDLPVLLWVLVIAATIVIFGRYDIVEASKINNSEILKK